MGIDDLSCDDFVRRWRDLTGETPAALLNSRTEMLRVLVSTSGLLPIGSPWAYGPLNGAAAEMSAHRIAVVQKAEDHPLKPASADKP